MRVRDSTIESHIKRFLRSKVHKSQRVDEAETQTESKTEILFEQVVRNEFEMSFQCQNVFRVCMCHFHMKSESKLSGH